MNNLKNTLLILALLFTASCVLGQDSDKKSKRVISLNMYKSIVYHGGTTSGTSTIGLGSFSPAVRWGIENEDFNEIEFSKFNLESKNSSFNFGIGVKYNYNWKIFESKPTKTQFYFGTGIEPMVNIVQNYSNSSINYSTYSTNIVANLSISLRMKWNVSDKFFVNVSLPYDYYTYSLFYVNNENPIIPLEQRKYTNSTGKVFPNDFTVKVGIGIKF